jgi:hypothetical protein
VRAVVAERVTAKAVLVAMHTSVDVRQATTDPRPGDPALLTFPCVLVDPPVLIEDLVRRQPRGFSIYRGPRPLKGTMLKEPYPRFYDLVFKVRIEAERMTGEAGLLGLLHAMTAWGQEAPRVAGLITEWRTAFVPEEADRLGDIVGATASIRLRDWPCYGGPPEEVRLVGESDVRTMPGEHVEVGWALEESPVPNALLAAFQPVGAPGPLAVGEAGVALRRTAEGIWQLDAATGAAADLRGLWGTTAAELVTIGDGGLILRRRELAGEGVWTPDASPTTADLNAVWGRASHDVYAVGGGGVVLHFDGEAWTGGPIEAARGAALHAIWGDRGGGEIWVVGDGGLILRRQPRGIWAREPSGTPAQLLALTGTENGTLYAAGEMGALLASAGDGRWHPADGIGSGQASTLRAAWCDGSDVSIAGDMATVLRRTSSGWAAERVQSQTDFYALVGTAAATLTAVGLSGTIFRRERR